MQKTRMIAPLLITVLVFSNLGVNLAPIGLSSDGQPWRQAPANTPGPQPPSQPTPAYAGESSELAALALQIQNGDVVADELVVKPGPSASLASLQECAGMTGLTLEKDIQALGVWLLKLDSGSILDVLPSLQNCPDVIYAEENYIVHMTGTFPPNDPYWGYQYGLPAIHALQGWDMATGSSTVTIAILDTGVDLTHPDLAGKIVAGYDFVNNDRSPQDDYGHGTHVAGIAAALTNNATGVAGVSWGARIMPLKILDSTGSGDMLDAADAIVWATEHGAQVINMSFGTIKILDCTYTPMQAAIDYAHAHNVVIVAASGNAGKENILFPACAPNVIAVGATDNSNNITNFSNYGSALDLVAPGDRIYSTFLGGGVGIMSGTSMTAPFVAGLAAILRGLPGGETANAVEQAMECTALDLGEAGKDIHYGYGLIQMDAAIQQILTPACTYQIFLPLVTR
jgi:thermitase